MAETKKTSNVEGAKAPKTPKSQKSYIIHVDKTDEEVLKLQEDGCDLVFETRVGEFKKLKPSTVKELNTDNRTRYFVAVGMYQQELELADDPFAGLDIQTDGKMYSATQALEVEGKDPNYNYAWKSPESLQRAAREGFVPAKDPNLRTVSGSGIEVRKIGGYGRDELILCKQPKELHEQRVRDIEERSRALEHGAKQQAIDEINSTGKVYIPPEDGSDDSKFTLANPDRR